MLEPKRDIIHTHHGSGSTVCVTSTLPPPPDTLYVSICLSTLSIPVPLSSKVSEHPLVLLNCRDGDVQLTQAVLSPPLFRLMNVEETMDMQ